MKVKLLSLLLVSTLSISLFVGCGSKATSENGSTPQIEESDNTGNTSGSNTTDADANSDDSTDELPEKNPSTDDADMDVTKAIQSELKDAIDTLYNRDYSNAKATDEATSYVKNNFTKSGSEAMLEKLKQYTSQINSSDLIVTLVKEIDNIDKDYVATYEVRYNVNITIGKPSAYSDNIAVIVKDKDGNILIDSINNGAF